MSKKMIYLISFALVFSLAGSAIAATYYDYQWTNAKGNGRWDRAYPTYNWIRAVRPDPNVAAPEDRTWTASGPPEKAYSHDIWLSPTGPDANYWNVLDMNVVIPVGYNANCSDYASTWQTVFGPNWGMKLDIYGKLGISWTISPMQGEEGLIDANFPDNDPNRSVVNMYDGSEIYGPWETGGFLGGNRCESICIGLWWEGAFPYVTWNMYGDSVVYSNSLHLGGHLNMYGGTMDILDYMLVGERGLYVVPDELIRLNIEQGTLILPDNFTDEVEDWIDRGILLAYGETPGRRRGPAIFIDTEVNPGRTTVTASSTPPPEASEPNPRDLATDVSRTPTLTWNEGQYAAYVNGHKIYFSSDFNDVNERKPAAFITTLTETRYPITTDLVLNSTYYWAVDEVNDACEPKLWEGDVWSFTVADFLVVDNFEDYNNFTPDKIFQTWKDGIGYLADEPLPAYGGNGTGSIVGSDVVPFPGEQVPWAEQVIVNNGDQSMPFKYINDGSTGKEFYSEIFRQWDEPQDWTEENVKSLALWFRGYPATEGSYSYNAATDTFTVIADGADIWDTADEFHFVYKKLTGTGAADIMAKVVSVDNTDEWAKAGLMIRDSLDADSTNAFMFVTSNASGRVAFQARTEYKGTTLQGASDANAISFPYWVRLYRDIGNVFTAYYSTNGTNWEPLPVIDYDDATIENPESVPMTDPVYIGLAYTSHAAGTFGQAVFSDVQIVQGAVVGDWQSRDVPSNDAEQLYIAVEDSSNNIKVIEHTDPNAVQLDTWTEWPIDLQDVNEAGVDLKNIETMYIGVGDRDNPVSGGFGKLFIDDIRLHRSRCVPEMAKPAGDFNNDCVVDYLDLETMTEVWLGQMPTPPAPIIHLDASTLTPGTLNMWSNTGSLGGSFQDFNSVNPYDNPMVATVGGIQAVVFDGGDLLMATFRAPASITGNNPFTVIYTVLNPEIGVEEWVIQWAKRGGPNGTYAAAGYGTHAEWGVAAHWGGPGPDMGFDGGVPAANTWHTIAFTYPGGPNSVETVLVDGVVNATEIKTLDIFPDCNVTVGAAYEGNSNDPNIVLTPLFYLSGAVASVKVYDVAIPPGDLAILMGTPTDLKKDDVIDFKDYANLASIWLEELLWP